MQQIPIAFWSVPATELLQQLKTTPQGLTSAEAQARLIHYGPNLLKPKRRSDAPTLLLSQFKSPIILILLFAAGLSFFLRDPADALIILIIVLASGVLGFWQEWDAENAVEKLLAIVQVKAAVLRDGGQKKIPLEEVVPGEVVLLTNRLVHGICHLRTVGRPGDSDPSAFLQE